MLRSTYRAGTSIRSAASPDTGTETANCFASNGRAAQTSDDLSGIVLSEGTSLPLHG